MKGYLFMFNPWLDLSFKAFQLGMESQSVIALRMMRLASGGRRSQTEASRWCRKRPRLRLRLSPGCRWHSDRAEGSRHRRKSTKSDQKARARQQAPAFSPLILPAIQSGSRSLARNQ